ncbi:antitoxin Xre/MbcA/ParS toxin-binding domain-containing protein [Lysobacter firmicutimachus]|uniref:Antitoxin Xre/MbcA/ParS toxin-binding domain-containing protein n=1 Tax=Lysobacter firmicutimachus TaxID=1792846 RepID=A0AAU8MSG8_9GAMM|nr:antitoxin Xre/MbcA/ParS toxin-binding domain-containing protein [Lysobacter antibioticus]
MTKAAKKPSPAKPPLKSLERGKATLRESPLNLRDAPYPARKRTPSLKDPTPEIGPATLKGYVSYLRTATPLQRVAVEREGVPAQVIKDLAASMELPAVRMFNILGIAKATAESKAAQQARIAGAGGQAALGLLRLMVIAQSIVDASVSAQAGEFDLARWLGRWIEQPQPALGGRRPADLLDTPSGFDVVARLLGSLESGAYQ